MRTLKLFPAALLACTLFYWVTTSNWFIRYALLPRISSLTSLNIQAQEVEFSLFSGELRLRQFSVRTSSGNLQAAGEYLVARVRYGPLLGGVVALENVAASRAGVKLTFAVGTARPRRARPAFLPRVRISGLSAADSTLQLLWHHIDGRIFDLQITDAFARMDRLHPGQVSTLEFSANAHYQDGNLHLESRGCRAQWQLHFNEQLRVDFLDWTTTATQAEGYFGAFHWPESEVASRIQCRRGVWTFQSLSAVGKASGDREMKFDLSGTLSKRGFELNPTSTLTFHAEAFNRWFGSGLGDVQGRLSAAGSGAFSRPAGTVQFDLVRSGPITIDQERYPVSPIAVNGSIELAANRPERTLRVGALTISAQVPQTESRAEVLIAPGKSLLWQWRQKQFIGNDGSATLDLYRIPSEWLNALTPFPPGWSLESGSVSGHIELAAPQDPAVNADTRGELRIANFRWRSPQGISAPTDLNTTFSLIAAEQAIRLPEWHTVLSSAGEKLLELSGSGNWNPHKKQLEFDIAIPRVQPVFLPVSQRKVLSRFSKQLGFEVLSLRTTGSFRARHLAIDALEVQAQGWHASMHPAIFDPKHFSNSTVWDVSVSDWDLANLSTRLQGKVQATGTVELSSDAVRFDGSADTDSVRWDHFDLGANRISGSGRFKPTEQTLAVDQLIWENSRSGLWEVPELRLGWHPEWHLTAPAEISGRTAPELLWHSLTGGPILSRIRLAQTPEQWRADFAITSETPLLCTDSLFDGWPLDAVLRGETTWDRHSALWDFHADWTGHSERDLEFRVGFDWQIDGTDKTGNGRIRLGRVSLPMLSTATLQDSTIDFSSSALGQIDWNSQWNLTLGNGLTGFLDATGNWRQGNWQIVDTHGMLSEGEQALLDVGGSANHRKDGESTFELNIHRVDLPGLRRHPWTPTAPGSTQVSADLARRIPHFNFGGHPFLGKVRIEEMILAAQLAGTASADLRLDGNRVQLQSGNVELNGSPFTLTGELLSHSDEEVPEFTLAMTGQDFDLQPLLPLLHEDLVGHRLFLRELNVTGGGALTGGDEFWNQLHGTLAIRLEDIVIQNRLQESTVGKVLFLPLEVYLRLCQLLPTPERLIPRFSNSWPAQFDSLYYNTEAFRFHSGTVRLKSENGRIFIEEFEFNGTDVEQLNFNGSFGFGSDQTLDLDSTLRFQGLIVPVTLTGTLREPRVVWDETTLRLFSDNALSLGGDLFSSANRLLGTGLNFLLRPFDSAMPTP